jgi:hypothetical protein
MAIVAVPVLAAFALLGLLELMMQYPFVIMTVLTGTLMILTTPYRLISKKVD